MIQDGEASAILPQEFDQSQLAQNANDVVCSFLHDDDPMHATAENLDSVRKISRQRQGHEGFFIAQALGVPQGNCMSCLCLLGQTCEDWKVFLIGLQLSGGKEQILSQIPVIISRVSSSIVLVMSYKKDVCTGVDKYLSDLLG